MIVWYWFVSLAVVLVLVGLGKLFKWGEPQLKCPQCDGMKVGQVAKEPQGMRHFANLAGGAGGGHSTTQLIYRVTYRCDECQAKWSDTITESS